MNKKFAFSVIAHVDHGKTALCKKIAQLFYKNAQECFDNLKIEQQKNITIKLKQFSFFFNSNEYFFIDTPGHEEFFDEVKRSISVVENILLVIDSRQGIQSQTLKLLNEISTKKVFIVWTKIDLETDLDLFKEEEKLKLLGLNIFNSIKISVKTNKNLDQLINIFNLMEPMKHDNTNIIFDIKFNSFGYLIFLKTNYTLKPNQVIYLNNLYPVKILKLYKQRDILIDLNYLENEIGIIFIKGKYSNLPTGYFSLSLKKDIIIKKEETFMFNDIFCLNAEFKKFNSILENLFINDPSLEYQAIKHDILGAGYRIGFKGKIHSDVFFLRFKELFSGEVIITNSYFKFRNSIDQKIITKITDFDLKTMKNTLEEISQEFIIESNINLIPLIKNYLIKKHADIFETLPLKIKFGLAMSKMNSEFISDIKGISSGFFTLSKGNSYWAISDIGILQIFLNEQEIKGFSQLVNRNEALELGNNICNAIIKVLKERNFVIKIYAKFNNKILSSVKQNARENNVASKCYGGDITRKRKLWSNQKQMRSYRQSFFQQNFNLNDYKKIFDIIYSINK